MKGRNQLLRLLSFPVFLVLFASLLSPSIILAAEQTKPFNLSLNLPIPPIHTRWQMCLKPWFDELEKRTAGRVKVTPHFAQALSPMSENYDSVRNGIADLGECTTVVKPGLFPLHEQLFSCTTPSLAIRRGARFLKDLHDSFPELRNEFKDVKLLFMHAATPGNGIGTSKSPITSVEDCRGAKINVIGTGMMMNRCKALGFTVVGIPIPDLYMSYERGVVDGGLASYELMIAMRWGDVLKHYTPLTMNSVPFYVAMNQKTWDKLPKDIQKIVDDLSGDYAVDMFDRYWEAVNRMHRETWETKMGGKTHALKAADLKRIDELVAPPVEAWVEEMKKKGYPAQAVIAKFRELERKYCTPWVEVQ